MLELRHHPLADVLALLRIVGLVLCEGRKDSDPSPLGALVQSDEKLVKDVGVDDEDALRSVG